MVRNVPSHVSGTADEEQEVPETSSAVEAAEDRDLSTSREEEDWEADYMSVQAPENDVLETQSEPQSQSLNPDAPEFSSDHSGLSEPENAPSQAQSSPQRRRAPPAYLSDYQLGSRFTCRQHSVSPPPNQALLYSFLISLQEQIVALMHSLERQTDEDVRF